ncbi:flavodoxin family protein [Massilia sp. YIM B02443]|uniref:flavodoxin family protein n=1 Tax=Massilia sp. YIM B02443 TaxID=3050127 RepID=UPI0025B68175|nr:flavodoxin family protein [Massilia sp. YIM B02443]MDN4035844.1 flavodoxin family protein [Massilia sp. YIM B02443]
MNAHTMPPRGSLTDATAGPRAKTLVIIYHSAHGHTAHIAHHVAAGADAVAHTRVTLLEAEQAARDPAGLAAYDGCILGSPTYLGGVSGPFKLFMDATGPLWRARALEGRLAAGFTVSSLPAGDKQSTLQAMLTFCMQHGMLWVGNPFLPEQHAGVPEREAANRLGSWTGLMAQAGHGMPADAFPPGDVKSARMFGRHVAETLQRLVPVEDATQV